MTIVPKIYILTNINDGGTLQYYQDLKHFLQNFQISFCHIHNLHEFNSFIVENPNISDFDILWIVHFVYSNIFPHHILSVLKTKPFQKVIINVHDQSLFFWSKHLHPEYMNLNIQQLYDKNFIPIKELHKETSDLCLSTNVVLLCPSHYVYQLVYQYFPYSDHMKMVPHIDQCNYNRKPRYIPFSNRFNLCIPHRISYLKGDKVCIHLLRFIQKEFKDKIHVFLYGDSGPIIDSLHSIDSSIYTRRHGYPSDQFYEWVKRDSIHGFFLLNNHAETYCYCLSKCINTGLPCFYSNIEGAVKERIIEYQLENMIPLPKFEEERQFNEECRKMFQDFLENYIHQMPENVPNMEEIPWIIPSFYQELLDELKTIPK